jgi:hypothetical protein
LSNLRTKCVSVWEPERSEHVRVKLVLQICCTLHTEEEEEEEEEDTDIFNTETSIRRIEGHSKTTAFSASLRKGTPGTGADKPVHAECAEHVRAKIELELCCISFKKKEEMPPMLPPA